MLIAYGDKCANASISLVTTGGLGSSDLVAPDTLPLSFMLTPRVRQFCRMTTSADISNPFPQHYLTLRISFGQTFPIRVLGVFGHNLIESDFCDFNLYSDSVFSTLVQNWTFDGTVRLLSTPNWPRDPQMAYIVLDSEYPVGSFEMRFQNGFFRSGLPLQIGRMWASDAIELPDHLSANWAMDFVDNGDTTLSRNGQAYFSVQQRLRRLVAEFTSMDQSAAFGTGDYVPTGGLWSWLRSTAARVEFIALPRPYEAAFIRERMAVYGMTDQATAIRQQALADSVGAGGLTQVFNSALSTLERT